ncbi:MAG: helix-turn-helix domain-containing protein [Candidatus Gallimonas sp.]
MSEQNQLNLFRLWDNFLSKGDYFMEILSKRAERLKDLMNEQELRTPALAEMTKLDQSVISKFLRAERMPSCKTLVTLADFFRCSTDYLLGLSDVLDERPYRQRPPFGEQLNFLLGH